MSVDSGSTDKRVAIAQRLSVPVIEPDPAQPFTAAHAYNEGFDALAKHYPDLQWVQRAGKAMPTREASLMHGTGPEQQRVSEKLEHFNGGIRFALSRHRHRLANARMEVVVVGIVFNRVDAGCQASVQHGIRTREASRYATFCLLSKFPRFLGQLIFVWHQIRRKTPHLIEYRLGTFDL